MLTTELSRTSAPDETAFRQLRHQTKNALQRILNQLAQARDLESTPQGQRLIHDLERRVRLSSTVSDVLFGVTSRPGPLPQRLQRLVEATTELHGDPDQVLRTAVTVEASAPALDETVLRIAHEFVGNAVKHGLYARSIGSITVKVLQLTRGAIQLQVFDDGWGPQCEPEPGEGLRLAAILAGQHGGKTGLVRRNGLTVAEATLHTR